MTASTLPISRLVNVSVNLAPNAAQIQNISSLLVLGTSNIIDVTERYRSYATLAAVAADFGTACEEYYSALLWFAQNPQPTNLLIGRWAKTYAQAVLKCAPVSTANQQMSVWNAITAGSTKITWNSSLITLSGLNFSAATSMSGVASILSNALTATGGPNPVTCLWNAAYSRFEVYAGSTGAATITFFTATGSGTDISGLIGGLSTSSGAYISNGIAAETAVQAVSLFDNSYGQSWYGLFIPSASDSDHQTVASQGESTTNKHVYFVNTQAAGTLLSTSTTDVAYLLSQLGLNRTIVQYSSSSPYAVCSLAAKALTINYNANNSVIDTMYKQEPLVIAESLTVTQLAALEAKNAKDRKSTRLNSSH